MKQKSSLKDRLVGSRYFSFGITLSLFVLLYVVLWVIVPEEPQDGSVWV